MIGQQRITILGIIALVILLIPVSALPTTAAATSVGNNNATLNGNGVTTIGWFQWGFGSDRLYLTTPNVTPSGGAVSYTVFDYPIYGDTTYYYRVCDPTGCGATASFLTATVTPLPASTLGSGLTNLTESHFNIRFFPQDALNPYLWVLPKSPAGLGISIVASILLIAYMVALWWRGRNITIPSIVGLIFCGMFLSANAGFHLGISPEIMAIGQAAMYASIAGIILSFFKKG